jgi:hypothetical protein
VFHWLSPDLRKFGATRIGDPRCPFTPSRATAFGLTHAYRALQTSFVVKSGPQRRQAYVLHVTVLCALHDNDMTN